MNQMGIRGNDKFDHLSTTSKSSKESRIHKPSTSVTTLVRSIKNLLEKNQSKYENILNHNPGFNLKLYKPASVQLNNKMCSINGEVLMRQLDYLMEDECKLDKELNKIQFENQENEELVEEETYQNMDHYMFLRSIWKRQNSDVSNDERMEKLNQRVGHIKGHIKNMIKKENSYTHNFDRKKMIIQSTQYTELKEKYERLLMKQEDIQATCSREMINTQQLKEKSQMVENLQVENEKLREKYGVEKQKCRRLESELIKVNLKLQDMEKQLIAKQRQIQRHNREIKYVYENMNNFTLSISGKVITSQSCFKIEKSLEEIHRFLIGTELNRDKSLQEIEYYASFKNFEKDEETQPIRQGKMGRFDRQTPKKFRHIKGIYNLKSVDTRKPKFIRSANYMDDSYYRTVMENKNSSINHI